MDLIYIALSGLAVYICIEDDSKKVTGIRKVAACM